jgi:hypothetical protein
MRLNTSKCKVMHFKKSHNPPAIKLGNSILKSVPTYKYLEFLISSIFDSSHQWKHIEPLISKNIALLRKEIRKVTLRPKVWEALL